jgi:hypothetical protein
MKRVKCWQVILAWAIWSLITWPIILIVNSVTGHSQTPLTVLFQIMGIIPFAFGPLFGVAWLMDKAKRGNHEA